MTRFFSGCRAAVALLVGLIFTVPMFYVGIFLAYRWLQYGRAAVTD